MDLNKFLCFFIDLYKTRSRPTPLELVIRIRSGVSIDTTPYKRHHHDGDVCGIDVVGLKGFFVLSLL